MFQPSRLTLAIITTLTLGATMIFAMTIISPDLLQTQVNSSARDLRIKVPRIEFPQEVNNVTATVRLNDGSTQEATVPVQLGSKPSPRVSPATPPPNSEPDRSHEEALASLGPSCGNGLLESGETCDFGDNSNNLSNCSDTCQLISKSCNFNVGPTVARPGQQLNFSSRCFTEGNPPPTLISVNNKQGLTSTITPEINPARPSGAVSGLFSRNIPYDIEGGGPRGFYILRNGRPSGSVTVNMHSNVDLPETRLSGTDNWDVTLATPPYSSNVDLPETYLAQLPPQLPAATDRESGLDSDRVDFYLKLDSSCPTTTSPSQQNLQAGRNTIDYTNQRNIRLTNADAHTTNIGSHICLYLRTTNQPAFELQTQAPLFE